MAKTNLKDAMTSATPKVNENDTEAIIGGQSSRQPSREGKKHIGGYFDQAVLHQLNLLTAEQSIEREQKVTTQAIIAEALNDLFNKYSKPPIA